MAKNAILNKMVDRLYASMASGASLNCRPHASRQRIDLTLISRLKDVEPKRVLEELLGEKRAVSVGARVAMPPQLKLKFGQERVPTIEIEDEVAGELAAEAEAASKEKKEVDPAVREWLAQRSLLMKLRSLVDDARTYEQDTGVHALHIGYPVLSLPPGAVGSGGTSRVLAPVAFIPVSMVVRTGHKPGLELSCRGQGIDLVVPNTGLMAWLERQTGKPMLTELFADQTGEQPWNEILELARRICAMLQIEDELKDVAPAESGSDERSEEGPALKDHEEVESDAARAAIPFVLEAVPKAEGLADRPRIYRSAVLGLFPMSNESLLRDTQAMLESGATLEGPVKSFIDSSARLEATPEVKQSEGETAEPVRKSPRLFRDERLVAAADPCQSRTVAKARQARGLVVHGPPGTGKSQTITNIIGDHLARGERVLFVCDKRTALDVVANRLEHIGLGGLCALVHDPQRDQRDLYMAIRNQLDGLAEVKTNSRAEKELEKIDEELQRLHGELTQVHAALMVAPGQHGVSFHDLMGEWLSIDVDDASTVVAEDLERAKVEEFDAARSDIEMVLRRGVATGYPDNAWVQCLGVKLEAFLARPASEMRRAFASCVDNARAADATRHESIPPFNARQSLDEQTRLRKELAEKLRRVVDTVDAAVARRLSQWPADKVRQQQQQMRECAAHMEILRQGALDAELSMMARDAMPGPTAMAQQLAALGEYLAVAARWHGFLHFGARSRAAKVLRQYGLPLTPEAAQRVQRFLTGLRARQLLLHVGAQLLEQQGEAAASPQTVLSSDEQIRRIHAQHSATLDVLSAVVGVEELEAVTRKALADPAAANGLLDGLQRSIARAEAIGQFELSLKSIDLFDSKWLASVNQQVRGGRGCAELLTRLEEQFDTIEDVLRIQRDLERVPSAFSRSLAGLLRERTEPEVGLEIVRRGVLKGEISRRIAGDPHLQQIDGGRIGLAFDHYRELEGRKRVVVRDVILHRWRTLQKNRLVVSTGTRLNSEGATLRQRLFVRGRRAMRLRQVIALGQQSGSEGAPPTEGQLAEAAKSGSDPLFDLCPVWMASPSTVAQIFPLRPLFDVVVFDEASQCKLEEALPVLTRAKRVVVAGDPKQLPPTRFFEASVADSDGGELESDQDVFEAQQSEIEDLLAAALNLDIEESYLDVHYRSRNADLIEFSNQQFYGDRLQAIPGHPANRTRFAPITLHRADGAYEKRCNPTEARRVCEIVRDLLKRAEPPSIGIACFNLTQRDLIVEMLDDLALEDSGFAGRLATARERRGEGSFEGLFVKNLENVQGDERDHIIISTTYGRDPNGKFYRRFGPLGMPGGGRRLNVLVTRARHEVHLVTSIPREAYLSIEAIPSGQTPNGGWLLFAYLRYAEELAEIYETNYRVLAEEMASAQPHVVEQLIEPFSPFCRALAQNIAKARKFASHVHWGNEGFRIDLALHHPRRAEDVTIGLLCDFASYSRAQDPVEWDIFRTAIHESQGWKLHRVWTPQFFRDSQRVINNVARDVEAFLAKERKESERISD